MESTDGLQRSETVSKQSFSSHFYCALGISPPPQDSDGYNEINWICLTHHLSLYFWETCLLSYAEELNTLFRFDSHLKLFYFLIVSPFHWTKSIWRKNRKSGVRCVLHLSLGIIYWFHVIQICDLELTCK